MGIDFERGAFENPDSPLHCDDVDSDIVVVTDPKDRVAALRAVERCVDRWWGIDGAGRHHGADDEAFWGAQPDRDGHEWHTAKYVSEVRATRVGVAVEVDTQGFMPAAMRDAYRRVLVEELEAAGVRDAVVRSQHAEDYEAIEQPTGSWPPYTDCPVPGLPSGVPPGSLLRHELRRRGDFWNRFLQRNFKDAWVAGAAAATDDAEDVAVREICHLFNDAGWRVGEPAAATDAEGKPLTVAVAAMDRAMALIACQAAAHIEGSGLTVPADARSITEVTAYYENTA